MSAGTLVAAPGDGVAWRVVPWRRFVPAAPLMALAFLGLVVLAIGMRDWVWAVLVVWAAYVVLGDLALPLRFTVDANGVERDGPLGAKRHAWDQFDGFESVSQGRVIALRLKGGGPARWWRRQLSLYVPDESVRQAAEQEIERHLPPLAARR